MRKDVLKLAEVLSADSGINVESVYDWLMAIGKEEKRNPVNKHFSACYGRIIDKENPDGNRLEIYTPHSNIFSGNSSSADYWENRILARQERYFDD